MSNNIDLMGDELREIALMLSSDAKMETTTKEQRLDIFKSLTTYYVQTTKINRKPDQPDDEEDTFDDWKRNASESSGATDTDRARN